jgi:hypothetical protein
MEKLRALYYDPVLMRYVSVVWNKGSDSSRDHVNMAGDQPVQRGYDDPAPGGHHWVIGSIRNDPALSPMAAQVFQEAMTGPVPGGQSFTEGHCAYNLGVDALWRAHLDQNACSLSMLTKQQAEDFVSRVKTSTDPRVRNFNFRVYEKFIRAASYGCCKGVLHDHGEF